MAKVIQAIRGMHDIPPAETPYWHYVEDTARAVLAAYGYQEIRVPIVESTELFKRSIGEATDIVEKEMYTFADRNGDSLTLRPECTASCVRAGIELGLLYNQIQRLWSMGPMFRHERPQKGRYRQFHQINVEAFGMPGPELDAELILMTARLWRRLGLSGIDLQLNSIGSSETRAAYRERLVAYLSERHDALDEDSRRRLKTNPLRILDSKNPRMQEIIADAPQLLDGLDEESREHFETLQHILSAAGIDYSINPRLVRGLDYYCKTVFEWVTDQLGAQGTVCGGGRYDGLVAQIGGRPTAGSGFAIGAERLIELVKGQGIQPTERAPHVYLLAVGQAAILDAHPLAETLRDRLPDLRLVVDGTEGNFKSKLKRADRSGAKLALIIGDDELQSGKVTVKHLREAVPQTPIARVGLADYLANTLDDGMANSKHP